MDAFIVEGLQCACRYPFDTRCIRLVDVNWYPERFLERDHTAGVIVVPVCHEDRDRMLAGLPRSICDCIHDIVITRIDNCARATRKTDKVAMGWIVRCFAMDGQVTDLPRPIRCADCLACECPKR